MGRIAKVKIEFTYDEDSVMELMGEDGTPMTEKELVEYALESFIGDIYTLVKYSEVEQAVDVEVL